jgi:AAHS family benzoate transporter-like MFS transporter
VIFADASKPEPATLNSPVSESINNGTWAQSHWHQHTFREAVFAFVAPSPEQVQPSPSPPSGECRAPNPTRADWPTALIAAASNLFPSMTIATLGMALPDLLESLSLSKIEAGTLFSTTFILATVSSAAAGRLADKWGRKYILVSGLGFLALGFAAAGVSSASWAMFISLAVTGLGYGFIPPSLYALMSDLLPRTRGLGASVVSVFYGSGGAVGALLASRTIYALGWRTAFITMAGIATAHMALQCYWLLNFQGSSVRHHAAPLQDTLSLALFVLALADFLGGFVFWSSAAWMPSVLRTAKALTIHETGWVMGSWSVSYMIGSLSLGYLSDRVGRKQVILLSAFPAALAAWVSFYALQTPLALALGVFVFGMFIAPAPSLIIALAQETTAAGSAGTAGGIILSAHYVAAIIAPIVAARLITRTADTILAMVLVSTIPLLLFAGLIAAVRHGSRSD